MNKLSSIRYKISIRIHIEKKKSKTNNQIILNANNLFQII